MIVRSNANFLKNNEELLPMDSDSFPYLCMSAELKQFPGNSISWHWHSAFEIDYVVSGQVIFSTTDNTVTLSEGTAIFFNSNILHSLTMSEGNMGGMTYAHFFNGDFLSGGIGRIMESKYIFPIIGNTNLPFFCLHPENETDKYMLNIVKTAVQICKEEPFGYELEIRNLMSSFWIAMYKRFPSAFEQPTKRKTIDENRLRSMLKFMQEHFGEKMKLEDIAEAASIGTRECSRCFLRTDLASIK